MSILPFTKLVYTLCTLSATAINIPKEFESDYQSNLIEIQRELAQWKDSAAGKYAIRQKLYREKEALDENDDLKRFFLSKKDVQLAQRMNPNAEFSTNTPFTLMTQEEFKRYVHTSFQSSGIKDFAMLTTEAPQSMRLRNECKSASESEKTESDCLSDVEGQAVTRSDCESNVEGTHGTRSDCLSHVEKKDWTESECVSEVKNQGSCGSCWAFAAIGALESGYCLSNHSLTLFSEQEVNDCDSQSSGCNGGYPKYALEYVKKNDGVCTAGTYPYISGRSGADGKCDTSACDRVNLQFSVYSISSTVRDLLQAISLQPVAVAVAAGNVEWKQYVGGVLTKCSTSTIDHAVLAVGFGEGRVKIKNSWGEEWGAKGYLEMEAEACSVVNEHAVLPRF